MLLMASKTPPTDVGQTPDDQHNTPVETGEETYDASVDATDATEDPDPNDQGDEEDERPGPEEEAANFGVAVVNKGVAKTNSTSLTVSHRAVSKTDDAPKGKKKAASGSLPAEPELLSKSYDVRKVAVKDQQLKASYSEMLLYQEMAPVTRNIDMSGGLSVHPDLTRCLTKLIPFFAHVLEQEKATPYPLEVGEALPVAWANYGVTKVAIKDGGVVITGFKKLKGNRQTTLNTPFIDYDADKASWYRFAGVVEDLVNDLKAEVVLALEGKAFNPQLSLFEEERNAA